MRSYPVSKLAECGTLSKRHAFFMVWKFNNRNQFFQNFHLLVRKSSPRFALPNITPGQVHLPSAPAGRVQGDVQVTEIDQWWFKNLLIEPADIGGVECNVACYVGVSRICNANTAGIFRRRVLSADSSEVR
jgi:hypothetical protein